MPEQACPPWLNFLLINPFRLIVQNPRKTLEKYIRMGDIVLDAGSGPGYFTLAAAELAGESGRVIALDVQERMLQIVGRRAARAGLSSRITLHLAKRGLLEIADAVDFALVFWMAHEISDKTAFFREIRSCLKPGGNCLLAEPKIHVSVDGFRETVAAAETAGLRVKSEEKISLSRAVLLE